MARYVTVCYRPLTFVTPAFYGTGVALIGYSYPYSRLIPSIYTVAGATLNLLADLTECGFEDLERMVFEEKLRIYGVYVKAQYEDRKLDLVPLLALERKGTIIPPRICERPVRSYIPPAKPITKPKDAKWVLALTKLTIEGASLNNIYKLSVDTTHRVGVSIDRSTRTVRGPGSLYSYTGIARYIVCRDGECTEDVSFCVDLEIEEDEFVTKLVEKLRKHQPVAQDLGGEQSIAKPQIELRKEPSTLALLSRKQASQRIAVSHIGIEEHWREDDYVAEYTTIRGEKIEAFMGRIELLTGWLIRSNQPKPPMLSLAPGTIYWSKKSCTIPMCTRWWQKMLITSIPIRDLT